MVKLTQFGNALKNYFVTVIRKVSWLPVIMLIACGGGGGTSPETNADQNTIAPVTPITAWNLDEAFEYGMKDGSFTQQITVIENTEILRTNFRSIVDGEIVSLQNAGQALLIKNFQDVRENNQLTSWSTGKSFLSIIIGIAQDQGFLGIDDKASQYLNEWIGDDRENISIRNLLNMRSGLEKFDGGNGGNFFGNDSHLDVCLDAALIDEIDYSFDYNNCNSMLLGEIVERATGQNFKSYADTYLFSPLQINATWWTDQAGNYVTYCCVDMTQAEYASFGKMLLNKGNGIVSEAYINEILNAVGNYNLHFWLIDNTLQTIGFDGQIIAVDFNNNLVILRNSLYHPITSGDYVFKVSNEPLDLQQSTGPLTLPEAILGTGTTFSMSEFMRILKNL